MGNTWVGYSLEVALKGPGASASTSAHHGIVTSMGGMQSYQTGPRYLKKSGSQEFRLSKYVTEDNDSVVPCQSWLMADPGLMHTG